MGDRTLDVSEELIRMAEHLKQQGFVFFRIYNII